MALVDVIAEIAAKLTNGAAELATIVSPAEPDLSPIATAADAIVAAIGDLKTKLNPPVA